MYNAVSSLKLFFFGVFQLNIFVLLLKGIRNEKMGIISIYDVYDYDR